MGLVAACMLGSAIQAPSTSAVSVVWLGNPAARKLGPADRKSPARYVVSAAANATVTITFPFAMSPAAASILQSGYENVWLGFHCDMTAGLCSPLPGALDASLVHTRYWVPYLYHELRDRMPNATILLKPMTVDVDQKGGLTYTDTAQALPSVVNADFFAFTTPGLIEGRWQRPRTRGGDIAPAVVTWYPDPQGRTITYSVPEDMKLARGTSGYPSVLINLKTGIDAPPVGSRPVVVPFWDYRFTKEQAADLQSSSAASMKDRGDAIRVAAAQVVHAALASTSQPEDVRLRLYAAALGVPPAASEPQAKCLSAIYAANTAFDDGQTKALLDLLESKESHDAMLTQLASENQDIKADAHNALVSGIGAVATGMLSGDAMGAGNRHDARLNAATAQKALPLAEYNAKIKSIDVRLNSGMQRVNAATESELRARLRTIFLERCASS